MYKHHEVLTEVVEDHESLHAHTLGDDMKQVAHDLLLLQVGIRPWWHMLGSTASSVAPPTFSKYMPMPSGRWQINFAVIYVYVAC